MSVTKKEPTTSDEPPPYTDLLLRFPTFAVLVLQRRAKSRSGRTVAEVIEGLLWNDCYVDEAQVVAQESDYAGRAFMEWLQIAVRRRK